MVDPEDLGGLFEVSRALNLTDARVSQLLRNDPTFPRPVRVLKASRVWLISEVKEWNRTRVKKSPGRPKKS